ncbi:hypothetical protein [Bradyrhizobium sp. Leo121]|uniref:hypothetical protein n=1 Tax=Bradyrhizobium sp. Leo121 TaxID=1571195 RepID=UPI0010294568|nr:hypothetical protein [Bradyrhizobium sp. Leo121]
MRNRPDAQRQLLLHRLLHKRRFASFDREQVDHHLGFLLLARFIRQCVVALAIYLCIKFRQPAALISSSRRAGVEIAPMADRH